MEISEDRQLTCMNVENHKLSVRMCLSVTVYSVEWKK